MVIQRLQSLYLFIGAVLMVVFLFIPMATTDASPEAIRPKDFPVYLILNVVIALILFIAIFMYKNPKKQKMVTMMSILLIAASAVTGVLLLYGPNAPQGFVNIELCGGVLFLVITLVLVIAARRGIARDIKLLSSYDRIR